MPPAALRSLAESWRELQIRITQLVREGSPPPDLRLPPAKLSRKSNWVARGRIRQFESDMPSQPVRLKRVKYEGRSRKEAWLAPEQTIVTCRSRGENASVLPLRTSVKMPRMPRIFYPFAPFLAGSRIPLNQRNI